MKLENFDVIELARLLPMTRIMPHLRVHYRPGTFSAAAIDTFSTDTEAAIAHIEQTLGVTWSGGDDYYLAYALFSDPDLGVRGYTRPGYRTIIQMYDGSGTRLDRQYASTHELTHQIAYDTIGEAATTMLLEGLAMYAGQFYLVADGSVSLDGLARAALAQNRLIPITALNDGSVGFIGRFYYRRPYDEAGSFVQFLISTYGLPAFKRVYTTGDFGGVYGKSLLELQGEWEQYLESPRAVGPFAPDSARYFDDLSAVQSAYTQMFTAMSAGKAVSAQTYQVLDNARIAADNADDAAAEADLQAFAHDLAAT